MTLNPFSSWTWRLIRKYRPYLPLSSILRLRKFYLRETGNRLEPGRLLHLTALSPQRVSFALREADSDYATFQEIFVRQVYTEVIATFPTCGTIIDLGANIGLASLYFSAHYPNCRILAVEANPDTFAVLKENMAPLVHSGRAKILNAAAWRSDCTLQGVPDVSRRADRFSVGEPSTKEFAGPAIQGLHIDTLLQESGFEWVDLVKIDIEGGEVALFEGDLRWLDRIRGMAIEFHGDSRARCNFDAVMAERGFKVQGSGHTILALRGPSP